MHKPLFIANWKMNLNYNQSESLIKEILNLSCNNNSASVVICPSYTNIPVVAKNIRKTSIELGAQDISWEKKGSMTGEVSAAMLKDFGVEYVIVGHSERREKMGETDAMVNAKVLACLANDLVPIICVGETSTERNAGNTDHVVMRQVRAALKNVVLKKQFVIIAYEPVWVIGTGQSVEVSEAEHVAKLILSIVHDLYYDSDREVNEIARVLYGGSVSSDNAKTFLTDNIQGVLVGGASLDAKEFCNIVNNLS